MMADIAAADFHAGQEHRVALENGADLVLVVDRVEVLPRSVRAAGGFRLEFLSSDERLLPQATYLLRSDGTDREIFLVPVARDAGAIRYEAIFL